MTKIKSLLLPLTCGLGFGILSGYLIIRPDSSSSAESSYDKGVRNYEGAASHARWLQEGATRRQWLKQVSLFNRGQNQSHEDHGVGFLDQILIRKYGIKSSKIGGIASSDHIVLGSPIDQEKALAYIFRKNDSDDADFSSPLGVNIVALIFYFSDVNNLPSLLEQLKAVETEDRELLLQVAYAVWSTRDPEAAGKSILSEPIFRDWSMDVLDKWGRLEPLKLITQVEKSQMPDVMKIRIIGESLAEVPGNTNAADLEYIYKKYLTEGSSNSVFGGLAGPYILNEFLKSVASSNINLARQFADQIIDVTKRERAFKVIEKH